MILKLNENISLWQEYNPLDLSLDATSLSSFDSKRALAKWGFNEQRICIKNRWFVVLTPSELFRKRNTSDGYYRVIYIQINWKSGEYYIGKANRPKWSELQRYQGSGLKFSSKFTKHKNEFARYFIAACKTAKETEQLEASIVDEDLLSDEKCLNLVAGGGGTSEHPSIAETSDKKRQYMKNHPEQFKPMLEAARKAFRSGDTSALRARNERIKEVMSAEKYREMSRKRIVDWKNKNPEKYAEARRRNHEQIRTPEVQAKRKASFELWVKENPEKFREWQEKLITSRTSEKAKEKRKASLKQWNKEHPQEAQSNAMKRAKASATKTSKAVSMLDLNSGEVLQTFPSQHAAATWLVNNGKAKNTNCVSSISQVCLNKPCSTGYGYRKNAYGYSWRFSK